MKLIIELKQRAKMLAVTVAFSSGCLVVVLPGVAEAQYTDVTSIETTSATNEELQPAPEPSERQMVYPGDSLWSISQRHLGPQASPQQIANEAERIFELNRARIGEDPSMLMPGEELLLPPSALEQATYQSANKPENAPAATVVEPAAQPPVAASEASEPAADTASGTSLYIPAGPETYLPNERKLIGLGIIVLSLALAILNLWKLPMRRDIGTEVWGVFGWVKHKTPRRASTNEEIGSQLIASSQLQKASSESVHEPGTKRQAKGHFYVAGNVQARRKLLRRSETALSETPLSIKRRAPNRWATEVPNQQVHRALKRMADTRSY
jgi:hypothetical protein